MEALRDARLNALKLMPASGLRSLPRLQVEETIVLNKKLMVTLCREELPDGKLLFAIKVYHKSFFIFGRGVITGFVLEKDDRITEAPMDRLMLS